MPASAVLMQSSSCRPCQNQEMTKLKILDLEKRNPLSGELPYELESSCKLQQLPASCHDTTPQPAADAGGSERLIEICRQEVSGRSSVMSASAVVPESSFWAIWVHHLGAGVIRIIFAERG